MANFNQQLGKTAQVNIELIKRMAPNKENHQMYVVELIYKQNSEGLKVLATIQTELALLQGMLIGYKYLELAKKLDLPLEKLDWARENNLIAWSQSDGGKTNVAAA